MITRVMGKVTVTHWYVEPNNHKDHQADGTIRTVFDKRPELKSDVKELEPMEICRYDGRPNTDISVRTFCLQTTIHIGDECVPILEMNYYADLDEYRQLVDKVVKNTEIHRDEAENEYNALLRDYNKQTIEGDKELLAYCKLHNLDPEETDVDELRKVVYPQNSYKFSCFSANEMTIMTSDTIAKVMA